MLEQGKGAGRRRIVALLAAVAAVTAGFVAMSPAAPAASSKPVMGGTATMLISSEPTTWDNMTVQNFGPTTGLSGGTVYDNLITIDPSTLKVVPRLAESVTSNKDATVWTIKLRPNLKFTDGTALDAAAVKFNWDRFAAADSKCICKSQLTGATWAVTSPTTITYTATSPFGAFPQTLALSNLGEIASPAALQRFGASYGSSPETTVGAGPWSLKEWVRADHITLVKNPNYWDSPRPYLDTFILKSVADQGQKAAALQANQAIVRLPILDQNTKALTDAGYPSYGVLQGGGIAVSFQQQPPGPLSDLRVRKALVMAANLNDMNQKAAIGTAAPVTTFFTKDSPFYDAKAKQYLYNLKEAQKLVDEYVAEKGPIAFRFLYSSALKSWGDALLQSWAQLKNVSVTADFQQPSPSSALLQNGNYQAGLGATQNSTYPQQWYDAFYTGKTTNVTHWSDPAFDTILAEGLGDVSVAARKPNMDKITEYVTKNAVYVMLYHNINNDFAQKYVKGIVMKDQSDIQPAGIWLAKH